MPIDNQTQFFSASQKTMIRTSVVSSKIQRDSRTSLDLKKSYVWTGLITTLFAFIVSALMFDLYSKHTQNNGLGILFVILSVGLMIFSVVLFVGNAIAIAQPDFMWMTTKFSGGKCLGPDDLDCDPLAFDKFSSFITEDSFQASQRFNTALYG